MLQKTPDEAKSKRREVPNTNDALWPLDISATELLVLRIEAAEAERDDLTKQVINPLYKEAIDPNAIRALRALIKFRRQSPADEKATMDILGKLSEIMKRD